MYFLTNREFDKRYSKLDHKIQKKFKERRDLFKMEPNAKLLNIHKLSGKYEGMWSMNVTGDYRAIFDKQEAGIIIFIAIGTHSELFG